LRGPHRRSTQITTRWPPTFDSPRCGCGSVAPCVGAAVGACSSVTSPSAAAGCVGGLEPTWAHAARAPVRAVCSLEALPAGGGGAISDGEAGESPAPETCVESESDGDESSDWPARKGGGRKSIPLTSTDPSARSSCAGGRPSVRQSVSATVTGAGSDADTRCVCRISP
jgi:hypothetical protein